MFWVLFLDKSVDSSECILINTRITSNRDHSENLSLLRLTCDLNVWYLTLSFSTAFRFSKSEEFTKLKTNIFVIIETSFFLILLSIFVTETKVHHPKETSLSGTVENPE